MKKLTILLTAIILGLTTLSAEAHYHGKKGKKHAEKPKVTAALFYADWCGSCKILDPKIKEARKNAKLDNKDVLFVTFDLTNDTTKHQSKLLAESLGLGKLYKDNNGKTGYMAVVNNKTKKQVAKITKAQSAKEIAKTIKSNI